MTFHIDNLRGVATTPLRKICSGKLLRRTRVNLKTIIFQCFKIYGNPTGVTRLTLAPNVAISICPNENIGNNLAA